MYYVAHRLFAAHDRALGALVAEELAREVGDESVFLPFCDTDEEALVAPCKGQRLFELDSERLARLSGMIAVIHGPSLDDGVCMEVGYARRVGIPVVLLTTDFQTYGLREDGPELAFPDPLVETIASCVVRVSRMAPTSSRGGSRFAVFMRRNLEPLRAAARQAVERLLACASPEPMVIKASERCVFLEPSPYEAPGAAQTIAAMLERRGWRVYRAGRWDGRSPSAGDLFSRARVDWAALASSQLLVVDVNGPETPPGAAVLIGASLADGRRILAKYENRSFTFAHGREPNFRNLMIQYSVKTCFRDVDELCRVLDK